MVGVRVPGVKIGTTNLDYYATWNIGCTFRQHYHHVNSSARVSLVICDYYSMADRASRRSTRTKTASVIITPS